MNFQTADLYDDHEENLQIATPIFKTYGEKLAFFGEIVTVKCHEDNSKVKEALAEDGTGKVLVIDGGGSLRCALMGDNVAQKCIDNNWEGAIIYGCIRDSRLINKMDVGIKALNTVPRKTIKRDVGLINEKVHFASIVFEPGQFVYADEDGIVVSEKKLL